MIRAVRSNALCQLHDGSLGRRVSRNSSSAKIRIHRRNINNLAHSLLITHYLNRFLAHEPHMVQIHIDYQTPLLLREFPRLIPALYPCCRYHNIQPSSQQRHGLIKHPVNLFLPGKVSRYRIRLISHSLIFFYYLLQLFCLQIHQNNLRTVFQQPFRHPA